LTLDTNRIRGKLTDIFRSLNRLKAFQGISKEEFLRNEDYQDIARSRLLTAIEAALNICYYLAAKKIHQVPEDYSHCFELLGLSGMLPDELAGRLSKMARFRNRLVHLYWDIDYSAVYEIICNDLKDLEDYAMEIGKFIESHG